MKIQFDVSPRLIADTMVSAIEGNHMTRAWCAGIYIKGAWEKALVPADGLWYDHEPLFAGEFTIDIVEIYDESKPAAGANLRHHRCNQDDFAKGIALMATKYSDSFGDLISENGDAVTADVFLQCIALGEVRYG